jgi:hypothetical protein
MTSYPFKRACASILFAASMAAAGIPDAMHPDFDLKEVPLPAKYKTMGLGFLSDGRMVLATTEQIGGGEVPAADPVNKLFVVTNPGASDAASIRIKEVANNWKQMVGVTIVDDKIYVSDRDGFYRIQDIQSSALDLANNRQKIASWPDENKWNAGYTWHQWVFTPMYWQGSFYAPYSGSIRPGGPSDVPATTAFSGSFLKWDLTGKLEKVAGGLRSPNGANIDPNGEMFVADNQGSWLPSSTFMHMKPNKFYGHRQSPTRDSLGNITKNNGTNWAETLPYERPTAWLDHGNVRSSPSQPVYMDKGRYAGDWLLGDVNNPGLIRVALDKVDDTYNGAVFWFSKGMGASAINRMAWGKDGSLYVGTIMKIAGNWPGGDKAPLYKMTPKASAATFDMRAIRHLADGLEILFTDPVDPASIAGGNFTVSQWNYVRQEGYGKGKGSSEPRAVSATGISADGMRVHLKIAGLKEDYVTYVKLGAVKAANGGTAVWNNESWFTLNKLSTRAWNASVSIADEAPRTVKLENRLRQRLSARGLEVSIDGEGTRSFSLVALNGSRVRTASTTGSASVILPTSGLAKGLYLLEVRQGGESLVRPVSLSF